MEYVIQILIFFILLNAIVKLSFWKFWQIALLSLFVFAAIICLYPLATELSKVKIQIFLQSRIFLENMAVLITLESVIVFAYSFMKMREVMGKKVKSYIWKPLKFYPCLLSFPVLLYMLTRLFFAFPGVNFGTIAWMFACVIFISLPFFATLTKKFIPEQDLRLEIQFITNLFTCIIGLITTVNGNTTYPSVKQALNTKNLMLTIACFLFLFGVGYAWDKYKWIIRKNKFKNI